MTPTSPHRLGARGRAIGIILGIAAGALAMRAAGADSNVQTLDQYIVTGTRIGLDPLETPIAVTGVSRDDFETGGALSFQDAVAKVPGLQIGSQGGTYLRFATRGFRMTNDVLVLIDGVPFRQVNGNADLINIPLGLVERLEYAKGPGSSSYGRDAVGGVVQLFTDGQVRDSLSGEVSANLGSYGTYDSYVRAVAPTKGGAINADFGVAGSDGWEQRTAGDQQFLKLSDEQQVTGNLDIRASYLLTHFFTYRSGALPLINGDPAYGFATSTNLAVPDTVFKTNYQSFTLTPKLKLGDEWTVTDIANFNRYLRYYTGGIQTDTSAGFTQGYSQDFSIQDIFYDDLTASWRHKFGAVDNTFVAGGTVENGHYTDAAPSFSNLPTFNPPDYFDPVANAAYYPYGKKGATASTWIYQPVYSGYFEDHAQIGRAGVLVGARYDWAHQQYSNSNLSSSGEQDVSSVSPRVGLTYDLVKGGASEVSAYLSYSRSFKPLAPSSSTSGGVTFFSLLSPETANSYEGGFKGFSDNRKISWQADVYQIEKTNAQRFYRVNALTYLIGQDQQRVRGFEAAVDYRALSWLDAYANYAYTNAVNTNYVTSTANLSGTQMAMNPRNTAAAGADARYRSFSLDVSSNFTGTRPLRDDIRNSMTMPSYLITNIVLAYERKKTTYQVGVQNVGNIRYISDNLNGLNDGQEGAPRTFFGKVIYRF